MERIDYINSDILKLKIFRMLTDKKDHTPSELSRKLNTNGTTLLRNCKLLESFNFIEIDVKRTKGINYFLKITQEGLNGYNKNRQIILELLKK